MKFLSNYYIVLLFGIFIFASCNKEEDIVEPPNQVEVITTMTYSLVPVDGGDIVELSFVDLDGDGGNDATVNGGTLIAGSQYTGTITLLNETETPAEDITLEVEEEDDEHQMFFATDGVDITVDYTDADDNMNPLGLSTTLTAGAAASGTLTLTLRHEPNKDADGVSAGDITNAGGETDIEVTFPIIIQ